MEKGGETGDYWTWRVRAWEKHRVQPWMDLGVAGSATQQSYIRTHSMTLVISACLPISTWTSSRAESVASIEASRCAGICDSPWGAQRKAGIDPGSEGENWNVQFRQRAKTGIETTRFQSRTQKGNTDGSERMGKDSSNALNLERYLGWRSKRQGEEGWRGEEKEGRNAWGTRSVWLEQGPWRTAVFGKETVSHIQGQSENSMICLSHDHK